MDEFLDEDDDNVHASPLRNKGAAARRKAAAQPNKPAPGPVGDPPARMPRLTRGRAAATGEQPIAGSLDPDRRMRARKDPQGASPPASPPTSPTPASRVPTTFRRGQGPLLRADHQLSAGILPVRAKPAYKKTARGGANAWRIKRPKQQVKVVHLDEDEGFDDLRSPPPEGHVTADFYDDTRVPDDDDNYIYNPQDFEGPNVEQEEDVRASSVERAQRRSRSVRFSGPGAVKIPSRDERTRDFSRTRGTSIVVRVASRFRRLAGRLCARVKDKRGCYAPACSIVLAQRHDGACVHRCASSLAVLGSGSCAAQQAGPARTRRAADLSITRRRVGADDPAKREAPTFRWIS